MQKINLSENIQIIWWIIITDIIGKVGSKGELFPPKKIRKQLGLEPNTVVEYIINPRGELVIRKVEAIEDILKLPPLTSVAIDELEELSEKKQKEGMKNI
jgi:bifunctional DNA-binding transcriptional regulator/antitoxin component of YhaV-PrlF toxin-antitoxin module